jgi:pimeloyl-ACP methyl ester carboxylesterase
MTAEPVTTCRDTPFGQMRSRSVGSPRDGVPEVVLVQGMAVADYLLPGLAALGEGTRAHLVELPGVAGSGDPPRPLDVVEYGDAVAAWLDDAGLDQVVLMGHSSGTQVAARAAARRPTAVRAVVLASPTIDPRFRGWVRLFIAWRRDGRCESPGLTESHKPEWKRAGLRRLVHVVRIHLADRLEDVIPQLRVPVLCCTATRTGYAPSVGPAPCARAPGTAGSPRCRGRTPSRGPTRTPGQNRSGTSPGNCREPAAAGAGSGGFRLRLGDAALHRRRPAGP